MKCILEKNIKPFCCSSLILKQTFVLIYEDSTSPFQALSSWGRGKRESKRKNKRGLYGQMYLKSRTEVEIFFRDVNRSIELLSPYMQIRVKLYVHDENAAKHLHLHCHLDLGSLPVNPAVTWALRHVRLLSKNKRSK